MEELYTYLQSRIHNLAGEWISKQSSYEKDMCTLLGFTYSSSRYWDCEYNGLHIEIKKGRSIWLDEVRYCEILLQTNEACKTHTVTMFIIPSADKRSIQTIYLVDTKKLISFMKLTEEWAKILLCRHKEVTRSLNCQQSMTLLDVRKIADYIISV